MAVSESRGPKSDKLDAFAVAKRLRIRAIKRAVYKTRGPVRRAGTSSEGALCWRCSPPLRCLYLAITNSEKTVSHHAGSCAHLTLGVQG